MGHPALLPGGIFQPLSASPELSTLLLAGVEVVPRGEGGAGPRHVRQAAEAGHGAGHVAGHGAARHG